MEKLNSMERFLILFERFIKNSKNLDYQSQK